MPEEKPFKAVNHGKKQIDLLHLGLNAIELRPTEIHLRENGAVDEAPSFCIVLTDQAKIFHHHPVYGQISLDMLNEGLKELGYEIKPIVK